MVNPLSRVKMKNILEKKNDNLEVERDAKTLSDFAKDKEIKTTPRRNNSYTNRENSHTMKNLNTNNTNIKGNVEISSLIKDVIKGEVKIRKDNSISSAITLEAAAEKAKQ